MRRLKHPAAKWESQDLDLGILAVDRVLFIIMLSQANSALSQKLALRVFLLLRLRVVEESREVQQQRNRATGGVSV